MTETVCWQICSECQSKRETCCDLGVPLTLKDLENIKSLGHDEKDFLVAGEWYEDEIEDQEEWWYNTLVNVHDRHFKMHIKENDKGTCVFLKDGVGCTLGDKRPSHCKIYPFWIDEDTNEVIFDDDEEKFCYVHTKGVNLQDSMKDFGETKESITIHFNDVKNDALTNGPKHKEIVEKLVHEGKIE